MREVVSGLLYILSTGCQWRYVPKDLPPRSTLFNNFNSGTDDAVSDRIHQSLYVQSRPPASSTASA